MKIRPAGDELFRADEETDRHNEANATSRRRIKTVSEMTLVKGTAPGATWPFPRRRVSFPPQRRRLRRMFCSVHMTVPGKLVSLRHNIS